MTTPAPGRRATIDPTPRQYPDLVTLVRRSDDGPATAPPRTSVAEIRNWLLRDAVRDDDLTRLTESLVWRMVAAGLPVDRLTVHIGTLHPQLIGFYWLWNREDGLIDELKVDQSGLNTDRYRRSPLARVITNGETFRSRTDDAGMTSRYPLLEDLGSQGYREYVVFPMGARSRYHNAATIATRRDAGFGEAEFADCASIFEVFALHVERHIASRIAQNVLEIYLGATAGRRVYDGTIRRGAGESIRAVVWMSDLRGFSDLADRLPGTAMLAVLNEYFGTMARAVIDNGGEILKFIGDGLLAAFTIDEAFGEREAAAAALRAAERALADVERLNGETPATLAAVEGWRPLRSGIALHLGDVFFGNMGAPERLDFTVIGRAVNEASRVEALTKELGRPILLTEPVARLLERELDDMGRHRLRGFSTDIALYSPTPATP